MVSFFSLFFSLLLILFPNKKDDNLDNANNLYSLIFSSFSLAQFFLGGISLFIISINFARLPTALISFTILILTLIYQKQVFKKYLQIWNFIKFEKNLLFRKSFKRPFFKIVNILILFFTILIIFSSIGPINHPDAADYHVGYPFQFFKRGGFFIDGSYFQGLLGIADYANLSFIQENNIWLIRFIQIINLPFLILFLSRKLHNNIFLLAFITTPTFVMWSTVGKPLFLGESCLVIVYLIWKNNKTEYNFKLLIFSIIAAISFKISSLIIVFTLFIDVCFIFKDNKTRNEYFYFLKNIIRNKIFILVFVIFLSLLVNRYIVTENFAYPLLTHLFNSNDSLLLEFTEYLRSYQRDAFFPFKIFIGTNKSDLGSLGPAIFFIMVSIYFKCTKRFFLFRNYEVLFIGTLQLILLLLFAQGRADYYISPLILFISQANIISDFLQNNKFRILLKITLFVQALILLFYLSLSIFQNINLVSSYEKNMNKLAYGYSASKIFNSTYPGRTLFTGRNTRLYFSTDYLDIQLMNKCLGSNKYNNLKDSQKNCLDKYNVNQILSSPNYLLEKNAFKCDDINLLIASRNPFKRNFIKQSYCVRKSLIE